MSYRRFVYSLIMFIELVFAMEYWLDEKSDIGIIALALFVETLVNYVEGKK